MSALLQAARYDNYNSVTTILVTGNLNFPLSSTHPFPTSNWLLTIHTPLLWTRGFQAFNFLINFSLFFQDLLNAKFWHSNFRNNDFNKLRVADATFQNSCCLNVTTIRYKRPVAFFSLNIDRILIILFISSDVFLKMCKLLIFLPLRHPYRRFTSTLCPVPHPAPYQHISVQIITSVAICYSSQLTLHHNAVIKDKKDIFYFH